MRQPSAAFEPKNLFRNVYFWLGIGGAIFLLYVGFIYFTFLPRSTSEVKNENAGSNNLSEKELISDKSTKKSNSSEKSGKLSAAQVDLKEKGGWVDSDDRKMTIVIHVFNLSPAIVSELIRAGGIEIEIDDVPATIINSEPYGRKGFLTRAEAVLSTEKFDKFKGGETQSIEIKTSLHYGADIKTAVENRRFTKQGKTDVEGVKIDWK